MTAESQPQFEHIPFGREVIRKATHMCSLVVPFSYHLLNLTKHTMLCFMIPAALLMVLIDISRLRRWRVWDSFAVKIGGSIIRKHEWAGDFTGASYILASFCLTIALYSKPIAIAAIAFIIVGDTFAALIGRRYGKRRFFNGKSIEGSLACLVGTVIVAVLAPGIALPVALFGALVAAIVEALPFGIDDNVTVPILSGLVMTLTEKYLIFLAGA